MRAIDTGRFDERFAENLAKTRARFGTGAKALPDPTNSLTPTRPDLTPALCTVRPMPHAAEIFPFPSDRSEAPAVRLALASILATSRPTQLDVARCGVNMRRAVASLRALKPREGAPSPAKAIEELQRACGACGGCRGI